MLINLLRDEQPSHIAVAFDVSRRSFRTERYAEYKAGRAETPVDFAGQVSLVKEVLAALRIPVVEKEGYEADDVIATLACQARDEGMEVLICTGDKDAFQLVGDRITVLYPRKGVSDLARMDSEAVLAKFGVRPEQYRDLAALVGEPSDNLPGVPGVGPKTAAKWINQYGGLDGILARAEEVPGKAGENLRAHLDQVALNRRLNHLLRDVELPLGPAELEARPWDRDALEEIMDVLQFRTLRERLLAMMPGEEPVPVASGVRLETLDEGGLRAWLEVRAGQELGLDVRGSGAPAAPDAWGVAIADADGTAVALDLTAIGPEDDAALGEWLTDPAAHKLVHGAKDAWHALAGRGATLEGVVFDTELAAYLCLPDRRAYGIGDVAQTYLRRELGSDSGDGQ